MVFLSVGVFDVCPGPPPANRDATRGRSPTQSTHGGRQTREDGEMARPWSRKRGGAPNPTPKHIRPEDEPVETVRLDTAENAWWAQSEVDRVWTPRARTAPAAEPKRDILAEHFGDDWRTNFGFDPGVDAGHAEDDGGDPDPYVVLQVDPTATWDEIVAAHRHQARVHHPDRLFGQSEEEKAEGEEHIRMINAAYQELRVRRGM
jgi:hypothetical protein